MLIPTALGELPGCRLAKAGRAYARVGRDL
jgi:hypothetical protein